MRASVGAQRHLETREVVHDVDPRHDPRRVLAGQGHRRRLDLHELGELAMPDSLRALIASRLDGLDDAVEVLGGNFELDEGEVDGDDDNATFTEEDGFCANEIDEGCEED